MIRIKSTEKYKSLNPLEIELAEFSILTGINGCGKSQFLELVENATDRTLAKTISIEKLNEDTGEYDEKLSRYTSIKRIEFDQFKVAKFSETNTDHLDRHQKRIFEKEPGDQNLLRNLIKKTGKSKPAEITEAEMYDNRAYLVTPDPFATNLSVIFLDYANKLDDNYLKQKRCEVYLNGDEFEKHYGEPPWEKVNKYIESFGLNYVVTSPDFSRGYVKSFSCKIRNKSTNTPVVIEDLSSGEQVFLMFICAWLNYQSDVHKTDILLLDEPDATLHPEMISKLFQFIKEYIVAKGTHVIMTSHTPTTVALSEIGAVYEVNNKNEDPKEIVKKIKKEDALNNLLRGIPYIQLRDRSIKQVFVEDEMDAYYYQEIFKCLQLNEEIRHDVSLIFLSAGIVGTGGCDKVRELTMKLRGAGNNSVYGIIDWDGSQSDREFVYVVGKGQRYSLENYIFDPIVLASTLIVNLKRSDFFEKHLTKYESYGYQKISEFEDKQLNELTKIVLMALDFEYGGDETLVQYLSGKSLSIPTRFLLEIGHDLKDRIEKKIPELRQFASGYRNKSLAINQAIIDKVLTPNMSDFISQDVLDVFNKIIEN